MITYAIGDIHGCLDLVEPLIDEIEKESKGSKARVVFLGDYVDRGPESKGVIDFLISLPNRLPDIDWVFLKGNHEQLMLDAIHNGFESSEAEIWGMNGGLKTLESYGWDGQSMDSGLIPESHIKFLGDLPLIHDDGNLLCVHAGISPIHPLEEQDEETLLWIRGAFLDWNGSGCDRWIIHGHTPSKHAPYIFGTRICVDAGGFKTGRLACCVFDEEAPSPRFLCSNNGLIAEEDPYIKPSEVPEGPCPY